MKSVDESIPQTQLVLYDEFQGPELDPGRWEIARLPLPEGGTWDYFDPNTRMNVAEGRCEISVYPFSRRHDSIQVADNPKTLFGSSRPLEVKDEEILTVRGLVGAIGHDTDPYDLWDGFVTFNLFDFASGIVLDFLLNGHNVYALIERLYIPGITDERTTMFFDAHLPVATRPGMLHDCVFTYDRGSDSARWYVDGELLYRVANIPVKVNRFQIGMGVMTLKPISAPRPYYFPKSTSVRGQGMTGIWSAIHTGNSGGQG